VKNVPDLIVAAATAAGVAGPLAEHMHGVYKEMLSAGRAEEEFLSVAARRP
jgi:hypothetical protein